MREIIHTKVVGKSEENRYPYLTGTIFADGDKIDGCTHDVYTEEAYASLLARSLTSGSTVSGGPCDEHGGKHFIFKGGSHQHIAAFQDVDFRNYFQS